MERTETGDCPAEPPADRPPRCAAAICLHSPVQHEINIERSIAGRVAVAVAVARRRAHAHDEEEEDFRTHPDPSRGHGRVSCQQSPRETVRRVRARGRMLGRWSDARGRTHSCATRLPAARSTVRRHAHAHTPVTLLPLVTGRVLFSIIIITSLSSLRYHPNLFSNSYFIRRNY